MSKKRIFYFALLALFAVLVFKSCGTQERPLFQTSAFTIIPANGEPTVFKAEVAGSESEQAYGLMFAESLPEDFGMIFTFPTPRQATFWMKNTLIPLDLLFIAPNGIISHIVHMAEPGNLTPIPSKGLVIAVIEINGGIARKLKLKVGDKVISPVIKVE
ncbi:MAG: DUF192 domain-containing protein [Alphaproteobacteria bacterium]|nr:DUF192 domain-containing protein [Alphaproteobacteria bacterium]